MKIFLIFLFWLLNFGISWFNAYFVGRAWADSKSIKGWPRFITWCAAIMSGCGFTWCYLIILALLFGVLFPKVLPPDYVLGTLELGYVILIVPILGTGLAIWMDSLTTAWRRRDLASMGIAGWNTFAMAHNTYHAAKDLPGILKHLDKLFKGGDSKGKAVLLMILLVILALIGGALTTATIIRKTARKYAAKVIEEAKGIKQVLKESAA